jgi:hypothetical protein
MNAPSEVDRLGRAAELDAQAIYAGEETEAGRDLRARAAAIRLEAVGPRDYPVIVCRSCFRITGWTGGDGRCDPCLRHAAVKAAQAATTGWIDLTPQPLAEPRPQHPLPLWTRLAAGLGRRQALDRALVLRWQQHVDPGQTGPIDPEPGFEIEVALRDEIERIEGPGVLVRFSSLTHRFEEGGWSPLPSTRVGRAQLPNPAEFAGDLAIEHLASAWADYRQALEAINRGAWSQEDARREQARLGGAERDQALREQRHTAELLDG